MTDKLPPIPDEYEAQVGAIQGRAYETGVKVGRCDGRDVAPPGACEHDEGAPHDEFCMPSRQLLSEVS